MKILSTLVFIGVISISISSCNKESKTVNAGSSSLVGKWELRQVSGNFTKNYSPGNGSVIEFTGSSYSVGRQDDSVFTQGIAPPQGSYRIVADGTASVSTGIGIPAGQFTSRMILNDDTTTNKLFYQVKGDQLIFVSGYFPLDGGVQKTYQKQ